LAALSATALVVAPVADENAVLPFVDNENRVDEEKAGHLGEVSELASQVL
jgi:hypothetical protein